MILRLEIADAVDETVYMYHIWLPTQCVAVDSCSLQLYRLMCMSMIDATSWEFDLQWGPYFMHPYWFVTRPCHWVFLSPMLCIKDRATSGRTWLIRNVMVESNRPCGAAVLLYCCAAVLLCSICIALSRQARTMWNALIGGANNPKLVDVLNLST